MSEATNPGRDIPVQLDPHLDPQLDLDLGIERPSYTRLSAFGTCGPTSIVAVRDEWVRIPEKRRLALTGPIEAPSSIQNTVFSTPKGQREIVIFGDFGTSVEPLLALIYALQSPQIRVKGIVTGGLHGERGADIIQSILDCFGVRINVGIGSVYHKGHVGIVEEYRKTHAGHRGISYEAVEVLGAHQSSEAVVREATAGDGEIYAVNFSELTDLAGLPDDLLRKFTGLYVMGQADPADPRAQALLPNTEAANIRGDVAAAVRITRCTVPQFYLGKHAARAAPLAPDHFRSLGDLPLATAIVGHARETVERFVGKTPEAYKDAYGFEGDPTADAVDQLAAWANPYHLFLTMAVADPDAFSPTVVGKHAFAGQAPDADPVRLGAARDQALRAVATYIHENHSPTFELIKSPDEIEFPEVRPDQIPVLVDTDIFRDPDDLKALLYLLGHPGIQVVGLIGESMIPYRRSKGLYQILQSMGRLDIPIAEGYALPIGHQDPLDTDSTFLRRKDGRLRLAEGLTYIFHNPVALTRQAAETFNGRLKILAISPMRSLAETFITKPKVFEGCELIFMGQVSVDDSGELRPKSEAYNFSEDLAAAEIVIGGCQTLNSPMTFLGKFAAYCIRDGLLVKPSFYSGLAANGHLSTRALQQNALDGLMAFAVRSPDLFRRVFGLAPAADCMAAIRNGEVAFSPYDLIAAMLVDPENDRFFEPTQVGAHRLIGNTKETAGVVDARGLVREAVSRIKRAVAPKGARA